MNAKCIGAINLATLVGKTFLHSATPELLQLLNSFPKQLLNS
jgi:hypothetical protein